ncbi:MAG TPA: hypothetical protein DD827_12085 [Gammaproteobacteria bacterium]|nr:hypothetical protein [Gammaproteobacteria bacterium]
MIVVGIYISRDHIYGIKTSLASGEYDASLGHKLADRVLSQTTLAASAKVNKLSGKAIRDIAKKLMADGIVPDEISIACFGPFASLDKDDDGPALSYGEISPDAHFTSFRGFSLKVRFEQAFKEHGVNAEITVQTDVAASGIAEWSIRGRSSVRCLDKNIFIKNENLVFLTFCGGVGGVAIDKSGRPINGVLHPEMGQIAIEKHASDIASGFEGICPHHDDCLEGMACEGAFFSRFKKNPNSFEEIAHDTQNEAWDIHAFYVAQLCVAATLLFSPTLIVLGGDVFREKHFLRRVRRHFFKRLGGKDSKAFAWYHLLERDDGFLQTPSLPEPGVVGAACIPAMSIGSGSVSRIGQLND